MDDNLRTESSGMRPTNTMEMATNMAQTFHSATIVMVAMSLVFCVPAIVELSLAFREWEAKCAQPLQQWLLADGLLSILFTLVNIVSQCRTRAALEEDEELRLYIIRQTRAFPALVMDEAMDRKVAQVNSQSQNLQSMPLILFIAGWVFISNSTDEDCDPFLHKWTYTIMLFKLVPPVACFIIGCCLCVGICVAGNMGIFDEQLARQREAEEGRQGNALIGPAESGQPQ